MRIISDDDHDVMVMMMSERTMLSRQHGYSSYVLLVLELGSGCW